MADKRSSGAVSVRGDNVRVARVGGDVGVSEARRRFGGLDVPASLAGMLCALGTTVLLAGLVAGAGTVGYQRGVRGDESTLSVAGLIGGLAILVVAFLTGGWVAGRMARYDGVRNGVMTALWFVVLAAVLALLGVWLGDRYDFLRRVDLPQWFDDGADSAAAVGTGLLAVVVMLAAGAVGGGLGARYHRKADRVIVASRPGGVLGVADGRQATRVAPFAPEPEPEGGANRAADGPGAEPEAGPGTHRRVGADARPSAAGDTPVGTGQGAQPRPGRRR
jgi:hypothetical protein